MPCTYANQDIILSVGEICAIISVAFCVLRGLPVVVVCESIHTKRQKCPRIAVGRKQYCLKQFSYLKFEDFIQELHADH